MSPVAEVAEETMTLTLSGELTVQQAATIKEKLETLLNKTDHLVLEFSNVTRVDLAILQLLCSAHRMSVKLDKRFSFGAVLPAVIRDAILQNGFQRNEGCCLDTQHSCIWVGI